MVDIPRQNVARRKRVWRIVLGGAGIIVIALITLGLSRLEPAAPTVERATVWTDTVQRGDMLLEVRGTGTLVPEIIWWIPAVTAGRVERIHVLPGAEVEPDTVLLELSNPELELDAANAEWQFKAAVAQLASLEVSLQNEWLDLQAAAARMAADFHEAVLRQEVDQELFANGLISERNLKLSNGRVEELKKLKELEEQRLATWDSSKEARLAAQQAAVEQAAAMFALKKAYVEGLYVRAGTAGILEQLPVEVGQSVNTGVILAKVTDPTSLKAVVRVPETQARDVLPGQLASIDTRNGIVKGTVVRIDPAVQDGTVAVDVSLTGPLPKGARPDLTVVGTIEIEHLTDVLYVGRPVYGQADSTVGVFKYLPDGQTAVRAQVQLGRTSVNTVEIVKGLEVGDEIILSDMSRWDEFDRVRVR